MKKYRIFSYVNFLPYIPRKKVTDGTLFVHYNSTRYSIDLGFTYILDLCVTHFLKKCQMRRFN